MLTLTVYSQREQQCEQKHLITGVLFQWIYVQMDLHLSTDSVLAISAWSVMLTVVWKYPLNFPVVFTVMAMCDLFHCSSEEQISCQCLQ